VTGNRQRQPYWWEESNDPQAGRRGAPAHAH
jgi:hypothetical protein